MAQPSPVIVSTNNAEDENHRISHLPALFFIILGLILMFIEDFAIHNWTGVVIADDTACRLLY